MIFFKKKIKEVAEIEDVIFFKKTHNYIKGDYKEEIHDIPSAKNMKEIAEKKKIEEIKKIKKKIEEIEEIIHAMSKDKDQNEAKRVIETIKRMASHGYKNFSVACNMISGQYFENFTAQLKNQGYNLVHYRDRYFIYL